MIHAELELEQKYPVWELAGVLSDDDDPWLMVSVKNWGLLHSCAWYDAHVSLGGSESVVVMTKLQGSHVSIYDLGQLANLIIYETSQKLSYSVAHVLTSLQTGTLVFSFFLSTILPWWVSQSTGSASKLLLSGTDWPFWLFFSGCNFSSWSAVVEFWCWVWSSSIVN